MVRKIVAVAELESIVLGELRKEKGCAGVEQVTIVPRAGEEWICGSFRAGTANQNDCRTALNTLERRLRNIYGVKAETKPPKPIL
jgi:hypothetical protein